MLPAGLTIFGTRPVELMVPASAADKVAGSAADKVAESVAASAADKVAGSAADKVAESVDAPVADKWTALPQSVGSFYMGNFCSAWHRVHYGCEEAGTLREARGTPTYPACSAVMFSVRRGHAARDASHRQVRCLTLPAKSSHRLWHLTHCVSQILGLVFSSSHAKLSSTCISCSGWDALLSFRSL